MGPSAAAWGLFGITTTWLTACVHGPTDATEGQGGKDHGLPTNARGSWAERENVAMKRKNPLRLHAADPDLQEPRCKQGIDSNGMKTAHHPLLSRQPSDKYRPLCPVGEF